MKPEKNLKFKIQYVPLTDEQINRHKDFDALMSAYATTPRVNVWQRWLGKRSFLFGSGIAVGIVFSALLYTAIVSTRDNTAADAGPTTPAPIESISNSEASVEPAGSYDSNDSQAHTSSDATNNTSSGKQSENGGIAVSPLRNESNGANGKWDNASLSVLGVGHRSDHQPVNRQDNRHGDQHKATTTIEVPGQVHGSFATAEYTVNDDTDETRTSDDDAAKPALTSGRAPHLTEQNSHLEEAFDTTAERIQRTDESAIPDSDALPPDQLIEITADTQDTVDPPFDLDIEKTKDEAAVSDVAGAGIDRSEKNEGQTVSEGKLLSLVKRVWNQDETVDSNFINRYAQVSFVTPLSSNGPHGGLYKHHFSLNVIQGYTGTLVGFEAGGVANVTKGEVRGMQAGGVANIVGGDVRGVQFGGVLNTGRSLRGAQFGGVANVNSLGGWGFQAAGAANVIASADAFTGWQIAGAANFTGGPMNGIQIGGAVNVNVDTLDGGQIAGAVNVANNISGFQLGVVNAAGRIDGVQFGVINISDTLNGASVGLINVSRDGQFSIELWTADYFQFNGGIRLGNRVMYNVYAFGVSPLARQTTVGDSAFLDKKSLPFGFGLGLGGHIPVTSNKRGYIDIDGMTWTVHNRHFNWSGINMLNQLRVLGGYNINRYIGVFAGPVANVGIQDLRFAPFRTNTLMTEQSRMNRVDLWVGFAAGLRFL